MKILRDSTGRILLLLLLAVVQVRAQIDRDLQVVYNMVKQDSCTGLRQDPNGENIKRLNALCKTALASYMALDESLNELCADNTLQAECRFHPTRGTSVCSVQVIKNSLCFGRKTSFVPFERCAEKAIPEYEKQFRTARSRAAGAGSGWPATGVPQSGHTRTSSPIKRMEISEPTKGHSLGDSWKQWMSSGPHEPTSTSRPGAGPKSAMKKPDRKKEGKDQKRVQIKG